ncbi:hypothetical protein FBEOM_11408 [Fusarium beomiforme]|uniref:Uncharacterized protein n=1 Tax=Fusarium beomiforme TaxID=44412 RepID=A0A9P5DTF1_9HYPO|nr:hypothetical protein FBEOM_11408 [Fusarium beomiforme]
MTTLDEDSLEESASERFWRRTEYQSIWYEIFRDLDWLDSILSIGLIPTLVGWDMQFMQPAEKLKQPPLIALALAKPKGKTRPSQDLELFLSSLHKYQYHEHLCLVEFPKFNLYIGHIANSHYSNVMDMHDAICLLRPDRPGAPTEHKTLVLYYEQKSRRPVLLDADFNHGWDIWIYDRDRKLSILSVVDSVGYENWVQEETRRKANTVH